MTELARLPTPAAVSSPQLNCSVADCMAHPGSRPHSKPPTLRAQDAGEIAAIRQSSADEVAAQMNF